MMSFSLQSLMPDHLHGDVACEVVANQELSARLAADVREEEFLKPILPNAQLYMSNQTLGELVYLALSGPPLRQDSQMF